jgi:hypothetical protein
MSYVHCDQCQRAFDYARSQGCPRCARADEQNGQRPATSTLASIALQFAHAITIATPDQLIEAQVALRDAAPINRAELNRGIGLVADTIASARQLCERPRTTSISLASWTHTIVLATLEAATLQFVAHVEQARRAAVENRFNNVVDLFTAPARLEAAKRWVASLAA